MRLIGMLDSPFVRRVAVSLRLMGVPFEHRSLSVFRTFEEFRAINPLVKAPTLVADDGTVLMDSSVILQYAEPLAAPGRSLLPEDPAARLAVLSTTGFALAACEKAVQIVYERTLRPEDRRHQPWLDRVMDQFLGGAAELEARAAAAAGGWLHGDRVTQADVTAATLWRFARDMVPDALEAGSWLAMTALWERAEALPEFQALPPE